MDVIWGLLSLFSWNSSEDKLYVLHKTEDESLHEWWNELLAALNACVFKCSSSWTVHRTAFICTSCFLYQVLKELLAIVIPKKLSHSLEFCFLPFFIAFLTGPLWIFFSCLFLVSSFDFSLAKLWWVCCAKPLVQRVMWSMNTFDKSFLHFS